LSFNFIDVENKTKYKITDKFSYFAFSERLLMIFALKILIFATILTLSQIGH